MVLSLLTSKWPYCYAGYLKKLPGRAQSKYRIHLEKLMDKIDLGIFRIILYLSLEEFHFFII